MLSFEARYELPDAVELTTPNAAPCLPAHTKGLSKAQIFTLWRCCGHAALFSSPARGIHVHAASAVPLLGPGVSGRGWGLGLQRRV